MASEEEEAAAAVASLRPEEETQTNAASPDSLVVRLRGLPYSTNPQGVRDFFDGLKIAEDGVWLLGNGAGEAFVRFEPGVSEADAKAFDRKYIGERYIEVMISTSSERLSRRELFKGDGRGNEEGDADDMPNYLGVVRMRGLPWTSTEADVRSFFDGCSGLRAGEKGVFICRHPDGRSKGMAYAVFDSEQEAAAAVSSKDRQQMGGRYIELFQATKGELNSQRNDATRGPSRPRVPPQLENEGILKIKGLRWAATPAQIREFFNGHESAELEGKECLDVVPVVHPDGRSSGEAFAIFDSPTTAAKMRDKLNGKELDGRWLNLILTNRQEMVHTVEYFGTSASQPFGGVHAGYGGAYNVFPGRSGGEMSALRMRGIPWTTSVQDVQVFFQGYRLLPMPHGVLLVSNASGRSAGEAYAAFESEEEASRAQQAMDRQKMGTRYVELFRCSRAEMNQIAEAGGVKPLGAGGVAMAQRGPAGPRLAGSVPYPTGAPGGYAYGVPYSHGTGGMPLAGNAAAGMGAGMGGAFSGHAAYENAPGFDGRAAPGPGRSPVTCCKLRGLPFSATHQDIFNFFSGLQVIGTLLVRDSAGRPTGEAFCEFNSPYEVTLAGMRHRAHMGSRYVEVFPCTKEEVLSYYNRASGDGGGAAAPAPHVNQSPQTATGASGNPNGALPSAYMAYPAAPTGYGAAIKYGPGPSGQNMPGVAPSPGQMYTDPYAATSSGPVQGGTGGYAFYGGQPQGGYGPPRDALPGGGVAGYPPQNGY
uniref:RRM domain-containing protein n=1 Tax=Pinguiococcus pyrenoidosus TaxID=172671 RepID=A0A7R9U5K5_9STRA|mmetsp:Transcript_1564/g.6812  ORF Transcript_1564/g.6812 Transcript_1564/m.6812 type:complete len:759 (+) Transcript_1564:105-2381(+)